MAETLTITRPDDWHLHLRDGDALAVTVPATAGVFRRAIVMPNLVPPVTTVADALAYRARILEAVPAGVEFDPLMTLYLTDVTTPDEIRRAADSEHVHAVKLYPSGATTNSDAGVTTSETSAGTTSMSYDAFAALVRARRTHMLVERDLAVDPEIVESLCELATWAPNHKRTHPWRFAAFTGEGRGRLGAAFVADMVERGIGDAGKHAKTLTKYGAHADRARRSGARHTITPPSTRRTAMPSRPASRTSCSAPPHSDWPRSGRRLP